MAKGTRGGKRSGSLSLVGQAIKYKLEQAGFKVNPDNTVTLYHMTPPEFHEYRILFRYFSLFRPK